MHLAGKIMTGIHEIGRKDSFEGTEYRASSRWVRVSGLRPQSNERFVLDALDIDAPSCCEMNGDLLVEEMGTKPGYLKVLTPEGNFVEWALYAPLPGNRTVSLVGNWISMDLDLPIFTPIYSKQEVRKAFENGRNLR